VDTSSPTGVVVLLLNLPIALSMPGWPETLFILVVVVLLFGAKKLPALARGLGQSLGEFKKARDEFERELRNSTAEVEVKTPAEKQPHQEPADRQPHQPS
jgi:sec-independent protein translocase protein TatA